MPALSRVRFAALSLALSFLAAPAVTSSVATAQDCPTCHPHHFHHRKHAYKSGEYDRYGGLDARGVYGGRGVHGPYSGAGDCQYRDYGSPDLFRQYYAGNNCGGVPAGMYPAPMNTIPTHVGHVHYTYQPLMPHEFLYPHHRTYHRYYNDGRGLTRTKVTWLW